ncbi:MAG: 50S ribosomal protein L10 [Firmicutes bacterium]|nr:50S ribosomal protein L10 [Bacillota bacterium]
MEKKSKARLEKEKTISEIETNLKTAKSVVFVDYRGITLSEVTKLRSKLRKAGVVYKVYKNNLMRIALNNLGITGLDEKLAGTLAVAFGMQDEVAGAKIILDEKFKDKMALQFGLLGNDILDEAGVKALATMPSKEVLVAQLLGLLQSGARNIATVVNAVPRNLAVVIDQRSKQLSA